MTAPTAQKTVAILGASTNPERYAWLAQQALKAQQYRVVPVSTRYQQVDGIATAPSLADIDGEIDTVTLYLNPRNLAGHVDEIIAARPRRVIFNPGSESPDIARRLSAAGIEVDMACTLVLLRTGQF